MNTWFEHNDKVIDNTHLAAGIVDLASRRGANREKILRGTRLFYEDIKEGSQKLSAQQYSRLFNNAEKYLVNQDVSFLIGRRLFPGNASGLSALLMNAKDINNVYRILLCNQFRFFPFVYFIRERHSGKTFFILNPSIQGELSRFVVEMIFTAINSASKWLHGHQIPIRFHFSYERPLNIFQYEENLGLRLNFRQHLTMVEIGDEWIHRSIINSNKRVRREGLQQCKALNVQEGYSIGLLQYLHRIFEKNGYISLHDTAELMYISSATLKRKLKMHGTSFQSLQDKLRKQHAIFDLTVRNKNNAEVAYSLDFNDLPNFRRAFKRWTGFTPSEIRHTKV